MKFLGQGFQKLDHEQDRQTDKCDRMYYNAALATTSRTIKQDIMKSYLSYEHATAAA